MDHVRQDRVRCSDRFSSGTAYQRNPLSTESSTRSVQRPPLEYAQPLQWVEPVGMAA